MPNIADIRAALYTGRALLDLAYDTAGPILPPPVVFDNADRELDREASRKG